MLFTHLIRVFIQLIVCFSDRTDVFYVDQAVIPQLSRFFFVHDFYDNFSVSPYDRKKSFWIERLSMLILTGERNDSHNPYMKNINILLECRCTTKFCDDDHLQVRSCWKTRRGNSQFRTQKLSFSTIFNFVLYSLSLKI